MIGLIRERMRQGYRTIDYPEGPMPELPDRFRGAPAVDAAKCVDECRRCADACPTDAIEPGSPPAIDLGRCLFCTDCLDACPEGAIAHHRDFRLATRTREGLVQKGRVFELASALEAKTRRMFGRSLHLRQVSAGGCNGCEADVNVLSTVVFDIGRFGIHVSASPRHADGLVITGPVTDNMKLALEKTYAATPAPKIVIAVGACAISGGPFAGHDVQNDGVGSVVPVDLYVPGCPPHPLTILDGVLRLLGRIEDGTRPLTTTGRSD